MNIQFSTIDKATALRYLQKSLQGYELTADNTKCLLDLVGTKIRVGDPFMYNGQAPLYPMGDLSEVELNEIRDVSLKFMSSLTRKTN